MLSGDYRPLDHPTRRQKGDDLTVQFSVCESSFPSWFHFDDSFTLLSSSNHLPR